MEYDYKYIGWHAVSNNKSLNKALQPLVNEYADFYITQKGIANTKSQKKNLSDAKYHLKSMLYGLIAIGGIGVISRDIHDYKRTEYLPVHWTYKNTISKLNWLIANDYITQQLGDNITHTSTIIFMTSKLHEIIKKSNLSTYQIRTAIIPNLNDINFVEFNRKIKGDNKKELLDYKQSDFEDREWRKITKDKMMLKSYNKLYQDSKIILSIKDYDNLNDKQVSDLILFIFSNRISLKFYNNNSILPESQITIPPNPYGAKVPEDEPTTREKENSPLSIEHIPTNTQKQLKPLYQRALEGRNWLSKFVQYTMEIKIECYLVRIWTRDKSMKYGGRFYYRPMHGISPQSIPSSIRKYMIINGEEIVEPDYKSLHIRMLYHMFARNIEIPEDCYYHESIKREHMKIMALVAINAKTEHEALRAFMNEFEGKVSYKESKSILEAFKELHKPIAQYVCSDIGVKLQCKDSNIMRWIISSMTKQGIIACPIHDSVIVQKQHQELAVKLMIEHYQYEMQVHNWDVKVDSNK